MHTRESNNWLFATEMIREHLAWCTVRRCTKSSEFLMEWTKWQGVQLSNTSVKRFYLTSQDCSLWVESQQGLHADIMMTWGNWQVDGPSYLCSVEPAAMTVHGIATTNVEVLGVALGQPSVSNLLVHGLDPESGEHGRNKLHKALL